MNTKSKNRTVHRRNFILFSGLLLLSANLQGQLTLEAENPKTLFLPLSVLLQQELNNSNDPASFVLNFTPAHCYESHSFFCRVEWKLEQAIHFPVKFRLGDIRYNDWLEGKIEQPDW